MRQTTIIGIAGGSGSGKTTFALTLQELIGPERCSVLHQDAYYRDLSAEFDVDGGSVNFDHPEAIDFPLLAAHLDALRHGRTIAVPVYDYATHRRLGQTVELTASPWVIVEGILILSDEPVRARFDVTVFIDVPEEVRFARRISRDTRERGRQPAGVERQLLAHVKPMHDRFVEPAKRLADRVYSGEGLLESQVRDLIARLGLPD